MELHALELTDFRNYDRADVEFGPGLNSVLGRNGQGKTNLLEGIYLLCSFASHRTTSITTLVRHGAERAVIRGKAEVRGRSIETDLEIRPGAGLRARVNRVALERRESSSVLAAVIFSPDDLQLAKGGPEERRRFADHAAGHLRPLAVADRLEFERVLRQRNGALKAAQSNPRAQRSLEVWDEQLVTKGAAVVRDRLEVLERVLPRVRSHYGAIAPTSAWLPEIEYTASWFEGGVSTGMAAAEIEQALLRAQESVRAKEIERGMTLAGPHRDDLLLRLGEAEVRNFGSQGEQRSFALALRLAERDLVAEAKGEDPILLLDDVFSELDDERREQLGELVARSGQTVATGTSELPIPSTRTFVVEQGKVRAA